MSTSDYYAFPGRFVDRDGNECTRRGMTLDDYFAAKALMGLLSSDVRFADDHALVKRAYDIAAIMIDRKELIDE